ncbi:MAG: helix-turn-helix domain-containing protein [Elusimicrobiota bacterium]|nr:helix-turn-helix domain-containing protein [Elusimicrobiota bacterium]
MSIKKLGLKIMMARKEAGLSQGELAAKLGKTRQAIYTWENGSIIPSAQNLQIIADVLNKKITFFYEEEPGTVTLQQLSDVLNKRFAPQEYFDIKEGKYSPIEDLKNKPGAAQNFAVRLPQVAAIAHNGDVVFIEEAAPKKLNGKFAVKVLDDAYVRLLSKGDMLIFDVAAPKKQGQIVLYYTHGAYRLGRRDKNAITDIFDSKTVKEAKVFASAILKSI